MLRLTIRATDASVPSLLLALMTERLSSGTSQPAAPHRAETSRSEMNDAFANVMVEG
jgi:hypothetical protein